MSSDQDDPRPNVATTPVNGTLEHRELRPSLWERPHQVTLVGTTDLPLGFRLGLIYIGVSGTAFTYVVQGDANADGFWPSATRRTMSCMCRGTPPTSPWPTRRSFAALDRLIQNEPCLRAQRGRLLQRNSCRDPWVHETQARLSKRFRLADRRALEVTADLFNVLNFLDSDWGLVRQTRRGRRKACRCWSWSATTRPAGAGCISWSRVSPRRSTWKPPAGAFSSAPRFPSNGRQLSGLSNASNGG